MPNAPLPKPSIPSAQTTLSPGQTTSVAAHTPPAPQTSPSPSAPATAAPPKPTAEPKPSVVEPATTQPASYPPVPSAPVIGGRSAPPPTSRLTTAPSASAPPPQSQPQQPGVSAQSPQASPAVPPTAVTPPPKSLTALQSMASNTLPPGAGQAPPKQPEKPAGAKSEPKVELAQPKKSILRFLPFVIGGVLLLALIGFAAVALLGRGGSANPTGGSSGQSGDPGSVPVTQEISLEYWGLWEPNEVMQEVIDEYQRQNPGVTVVYSKQSHQDYRERLRNALVSGNGPDIFRYHATWVPMLEQELAPLPSAVMTGPEFAETFYPVAAQQLKNSSQQIVGIPLMYDGLALYYNTDVFSTAVLDPPTTWSELRQSASQLTIRSGNTIQRAGIAMGNTSNTEHFADILAVLLMQNNADLTKPNSPETRDALEFYTLFTRSDKVWDELQPTSTLAFANGNVAMMFAPSWRAHEVKANNPNLQFRIVPIPQLTDQRVSWANYWAEGVSSFSENKDQAWKFIKYLSSAEVQKKLHSDQGSVRPFGEIYSRVDLADELASDPLMGAYVRDARTARGWYMSSFTHDDGINDRIIQYYEDAINAINEGKSIDEVMPTLESGVTQTLRQYGVGATGQ